MDFVSFIQITVFSVLIDPSVVLHPFLFSSSFLCSQSYLQTASDVPGGHNLDPSANYNSPKFRSRNQSYMRAVSTLSQASCVSQVGNSCYNFSYRIITDARVVTSGWF